MKFKRVFALITLLLLGTILVACGGGMPDNIQLSATRTSITVDEGLTDMQKVAVTPAEEVENLVVKSSDDAIAKAEITDRDLVITGVKAGQATITVSVKGSKAKLDIQVSVEAIPAVEIPETGFNLGRDNLTLVIDTNRGVRIGAKAEVLSKLTAKSSDTEVVSVTRNEDILIISGHKPGSATITVEEPGTENKKYIAINVTRPATGDTKKLVIWADNTYWGGENGKLVAEMVKLYSQETGIEVIYEAQPNLKDRITAAALGGETADIVIWDRWETVAFVQDDMLVDLKQFIEDDNINLNDYQQEAVSEMQYRNGVYGLPLDIDAWGYWVNKTMVKEANEALPADQKVSELPSTWDEIRDTAKAITKFDANGKMTVAGMNVDTAGSFYSYIQTAGGTLLSENDQGIPIANFNDKYGEAVIQFWYDLVHTHKVYESGVITDAVTPADDPFVKGQVGIQSNSLLNGSKFYAQYIGDRFEYEFIPFPKGPSSEFAELTGLQPGSQLGGLMGGFGLVIPVTSKQHRAAWDLIKWWITDTDKVIKWAEISNLIPAKTAVIEELKNADIANVRNVLDVLPHLKVRPRVEGYPSVETGVIMALIPTVLFGDGYIKGNDTPQARIKALLRDMEKKANETFVYANM